MTQAFRRSGALKSLASYPLWLQQTVADTDAAKRRVVDHELFKRMRDARLPVTTMRSFFVGMWPTIERFPRCMAMTLKKASYGAGVGDDMARRYLVHNIRVEEKHAEQWVTWAATAGLTLDDLQHGEDVEALSALAHWCWYVCDQSSLAVAVAATNYAVEGATGEAALRVCSRPTYAESLPEDIRASAMRWLRLHAHYDDSHPWEALDIVGTLLGHAPAQRVVDEVRRAINTSYAYLEMGLDRAMSDGSQPSFDETASNAATLGIETRVVAY